MAGTGCGTAILSLRKMAMMAMAMMAMAASSAAVALAAALQVALLPPVVDAFGPVPARRGGGRNNNAPPLFVVPSSPRRFVGPSSLHAANSVDSADEDDGRGGVDGDNGDGSDCSDASYSSGWRVCRREHLSEAASSPGGGASSGAGAAASSPFGIPPERRKRDGDVDGDNEDNDTDREWWSKSAYQSALNLYTRLTTHDDDDDDDELAPLIDDALGVLSQAYRLYGPESVVGSYNGGKDAVVILHLMRAAHAKYLRDEWDSEEQEREEREVQQPKSGRDGDGTGEDGEDIHHAAAPLPRPKVIYFEHADEFPEVLTLLRDTVNEFDLDMVCFERGIKFGEGLRKIVDTNYPHPPPHPPQPQRNQPPQRNDDDDRQRRRQRHQRPPRPYPMAFVLGTRSSDPNAGTQGTYAPSSSYMPPFLRVNPVLNWNYGHVWDFLRTFDLPYCELYDLGYTSLGTTGDTLPCPALRKDPADDVVGGDDGDGIGTATAAGKDAIGGEDGGKARGSSSSNGSGNNFWPAYMLTDWDQERAGRIKKKKPKEKEDGTNEKEQAGTAGGRAASSPEEAADVSGGTAVASSQRSSPSRLSSS